MTRFLSLVVACFCALLSMPCNAQKAEPSFDDKTTLIKNELTKQEDACINIRNIRTNELFVKGCNDPENGLVISIVLAVPSTEKTCFVSIWPGEDGGKKRYKWSILTCPEALKDTVKEHLEQSADAEYQVGLEDLYTQWALKQKSGVNRI